MRNLKFQSIYCWLNYYFSPLSRTNHDIMDIKNVILVLFICIQLAYGRLPDGSFAKCSKKDPEITQCLSQGLEAFRPNLAKGIPEIDLPPLDPFRIETVDIDSKTWVPGFKLKGVLRNVVVKGISGFTITSLDIIFVKHEIILNLVIPRVEVTGTYNSNGARAFFMALESTGKFTAIFNDVTATLQLRGLVEKINDLDHLKIPYVKLKINFGPDFDIDLEPDSSGHPTKMLTDMLKKVSKQILVKIVNTSINNELAPTIKNYINTLSREIPLQDLLID